MQIHTVAPGDTLFKIARRYSTSPMKIIENNELENPDRLSVGQELLILTPTRTYTVRGADTLMRIADRFGVKYESLLANNPYLYGGDRIYPGQILAIKYDTPTYGLACTNGYFFKGTSEDRLSLAMPYLTYITVACGKRNGEKIEALFDDTRVLEKAREHNKLSLMRVYDGELNFSDGYLNNLVSCAKSRGYAGITLAPYRAMKENESALTDFLTRLKKKASEEKLLLFCEIDGNSDERIGNICDGYVLTYEKCHLENIPSFKDGEERLMRDYSEAGEPTRTYIDLSSFGYMGDEELTTAEAERLAYDSGREILYDEEKKIRHFDYNKYRGGKRESVRVAYESLENIKAKLKLISELGFMGISFDIMRVPVEYLMMFVSSFSRPNIYPDM